ncbi:MAG: hypothetical protein WC862_01740 [Patescibacteria group bacterium]
MKNTAKQNLFGILRIFIGWIFFWSFIDKVWGLGFETAADKAWIVGASPTFGFLKFATKGPFAGIFQAMAGSAFVDWLFMIGLLSIGLALIFGIGIRIAAYSGSIMLILMWLAALPPEHNPIIDEHIIYILVLFILSSVDAGQYLGLGRWWGERLAVKKNKWLK